MENCAKCKLKLGPICLDEKCFRKNNMEEKIKEKLKENLKESCDKVNENLKKVEKFEGKKYLKTWEALKALEEGNKVARSSWYDKNIYWFLSEDKYIYNNLKEKKEMMCTIGEDWYIYEEKKEIPKEFEGLKYLLASINNLNCSKEDCDRCPLGKENCTKLDDIFFEMKEKYEF